jgi:hypothetical protein
MVKKLTAEEQIAVSGVHSRNVEYVYHVARGSMNTIRDPVLPVVACWKIEGISFGFGDAFVKPDARMAFRQLEQLLERFPNTLLSLFGHADPVGSDVSNKKVSEDRARAIYAVLVRDYEAWGDILGVRELQSSLVECGTDPGHVDGIMGPRTRGAVQSYMHELCGELVLAKNDFLASGECAYQGCSEFNPLKVFSKDMETMFAENDTASARDIENLPNRRVVGFLFEKKDDVEPERWPCPSAADGIGGCQKQFWANADVRRKPGAELRQRTHSVVGLDSEDQAEISSGISFVTFEDSDPDYQSAKDTFGCRFYEKLAGNSPCEVVRDLVFLELNLHGSGENAGEKTRYTLFFGENERRGFTDENGWLEEWVLKSANGFIIEWDVGDTNDQGERVIKRMVL